MGLHLGLALGNAQPVGPASSITIDTAPAITGTAEVGETLTRTVGSYSGDGTITVSNGRWTRNGVDIAGATGATYTLVAADDQTTVRWYEDVADAGSGDTLESPSNGKYVTYAAPTASGGLTDQSFTEDTGAQTYDVSGDFTNAVGGTWSLPTTIAGVTINSSGVVSFNTDTLAVQAGTSIVARYTNSGGSDDSGFSLTIAEDTTPALSATLDSEMEIDGSGDISLTVTAPSDYAGGPYTTDQSTAATGNLNTASIETGPQCAIVPAISRTSGASDTVGAVYTRVSGLWLYDGDDTLTLAGEWYLDGVATGETGATYTSDTAGDVDWRDSASGAGATRTAISNEITVAAAATAPAAFTSGQWTAATGSGASEIDINITALPSDGGSSITALQYSVDSGSTWANLTGTGTGSRTIDQHSDGSTGTLTAATSYNIEVRAVNAVGNGADSDTKATTTGAAAAADPAGDIATLLGSKAKGLYDTMDWSAMWQDTGGTTAVTAAGQPVRRIDDLSGGGNHLTVNSGNAISRSGHLDWNGAVFVVTSSASFTTTMEFYALIDPANDADDFWTLLGRAGGAFSGVYVGIAQDGGGSSVASAGVGSPTITVDNVTVTNTRQGIFDAMTSGGGYKAHGGRALSLAGFSDLAPLGYSLPGTVAFDGDVRLMVLSTVLTTGERSDLQDIFDGAK